MNILILGGTRFIGPPLVRALAGAGHRVAVFHRGETRAPLPDGTHEILGDRRALGEHEAAIRAFAPDLVIDMIAMTEDEAREAVRAFAGVAASLVTLSSMDVYLAYGRIHGTEPGPPVETPIPEDGLLRTRLYPYRGKGSAGGATLDDYEKILVERAVLGASAPKGRILRLPAVYGPGDYQHRLFAYAKRMADARPAILLGETQARWRFQYGYVENVADTVAFAATSRDTPRVLNIGDFPALSTVGLVEALARATGYAGHIVVLPDDEMPAHLKIPVDLRQDLACDLGRLRRALGFRPQIAMNEALARTAAWELAHPPAAIDSRRFDYEAEDRALGQSARWGQGG